MSSHKTKRITEDVHHELTAAFRELKDPRIQDLVSIVRADAVNDLSYCTVYVSAMEELDKAKTAVGGLKSAGGYIRRELGLHLKLRRVPVLLFHATDSTEYDINISRLPSGWKDGEEENREKHDD